MSPYNMNENVIKTSNRYHYLIFMLPFHTHQILDDY